MPAARSLTVALAAVAVVAVGCAGSKGSSGTSSSPARTTATSASSVPARVAGSITDVKVSTGKTPTVTLPSAPFTVAKTAVRVLHVGTGAAVASGQNVTVNIALIDGASGKQTLSDFGKASEIFYASPKTGLPAITKATVGQKIGSRVLVAAAPADAFGPRGNPQIGVGANDTVVFLVDVLRAHTPLAKATGRPDPAASGLPTVKGATNPTITVPKKTAPTKLIVAPLIKGTGAVITSGQTITVHYTGVIWATGKTFDSSWKNGSPTNFVIGRHQVIPGWDTGLVGQHVGSRVLLVVPPAQGYGPKGTGPIKGTDTLVFAVDLLDAQ